MRYKAGMREPPPPVIIATLGNLREAGYDGLEIRCECGRTLCWPFRLMVRRFAPATEVRALLGRLSCKACGRKITDIRQIRPWMVSDGQPDVGRPQK